MMVIPLQVKLTQITPFTTIYHMYTMQKQQTQLIGILISGEGVCGEGEWIPLRQSWCSVRDVFSVRIS